MSDSTARDDWIRRVLGVDVGRTESQSAQRGRDAAATIPRGTVAYRTMLLRWRRAQSDVADNLAAVGRAVLAHPEVQGDPRLGEVERAVAELPKLVPTFGGALEDVLDAAMSTADPTETARLAKQGVAAIDSYRNQLGAASQLLELEEFASSDLGAGTALRSALDGVLAEMRQELSARV
jgi:hypothetical protein